MDLVTFVVVVVVAVMFVNTHHFHAEQMPHALLNPYAYVPLQDW
jgi:hypothetical protein